MAPSAPQAALAGLALVLVALALSLAAWSALDPPYRGIHERHGGRHRHRDWEADRGGLGVVLGRSGPHWPRHGAAGLGARGLETLRARTAVVRALLLLEAQEVMAAFQARPSGVLAPASGDVAALLPAKANSGKRLELK